MYGGLKLSYPGYSGGGKYCNNCNCYHSSHGGGTKHGGGGGGGGGGENERGGGSGQYSDGYYDDYYGGSGGRDEGDSYGNTMWSYPGDEQRSRGSHDSRGHGSKTMMFFFTKPQDTGGNGGSSGTETYMVNAKDLYGTLMNGSSSAGTGTRAAESEPRDSGVSTVILQCCIIDE